jgi:hypothetical protein
MKPIAASILIAALFATYGDAQDKNFNRLYMSRIVQADQEWQGTGILLEPTHMACVKATGLWSHGIQGIQGITPYYGPRGFAKDQAALVPEVVSRTGALIGRVGNLGAFVIEDHLCFVPTYSGELFLQMNDEPGTFGNNRGVMKVQILIEPIA